MQSCRPAELILVDDHSADETPALLQQIASQYVSGWIRVLLLEKNRGAGSARNAGWAIARQPYIAFLDSDDAWHPEKIRIQLQHMQDNPDVTLCGHAHRISSSALIPNWQLFAGCNNSIVSRITKTSMLISNRFITPSVMVKREIAQRFEEQQRHMEDHMLWLEIVCSGARVDRLSLPLAAIYKSSYGQGGLSAQLWLMECGDLGNYHRLMVRGYITRIQYLAYSAYSFAKFLRRLITCRFFVNNGK
jgi:glycosyltransferase involved in cell wall biosynthesis